MHSALNGKIYLYYEMGENRFVIRVYGIYINPQAGLLVSDEIVKGKNITKFPGGGLEYGEGTIDCLKREMIEETRAEFEILSHFYTTDFFVESAFGAGMQVISIYYLIKPVSILNIPIASKQFEFERSLNNSQSFRYIEVNKIREDQFTLPIDRRVAFLLADRYLKSQNENNHPI